MLRFFLLQLRKFESLYYIYLVTFFTVAKIILEIHHELPIIVVLVHRLTAWGIYAMFAFLDAVPTPLLGGHLRSFVYCFFFLYYLCLAINWNLSAAPDPFSVYVLREWRLSDLMLSYYWTMIAFLGKFCFSSVFYPDIFVLF